jgi:hypothetical protein
MSNSQIETRNSFLKIVRMLLLGPFLEDETLSNIPSDADPTDVYLTGILWPRDTALEKEHHDACEGPADAGRKETEQESSMPLFSMRKPASIGISCTIEGEHTPFVVTISGARYVPSTVTSGETESGRDWVRQPFRYEVAVLGDESRPAWRTREFLRPDGSREQGIDLHVRRRVRKGFLIVTATLVNSTPPNRDRMRGEFCLFQSRVEIRAGEGLRGGIVARPWDASIPDPDMESGNLLYRNKREYAVGHGVAASWSSPIEERVLRVQSEWSPEQPVHAVAREGHPALKQLVTSVERPFAAENLADERRRQKSLSALRELCRLYSSWILERQKELPGLASEELRETGDKHLKICETAAKRMSEGIDVLETDATAWKAFRLANEAMHLQSVAPARKKPQPLVWFPFQIAFLLLSIPSVVKPDHDDRKTLDLLWFPTGGGKTEAYLGLTAFTIFYRRLSGQDDTPNVSVLMRYTLRLLTVQQFQRAAAMICAAELIRRRMPELGKVPISIGLYVGEQATPNRVVAEKGRISAKSQLEEERKGGTPSCTPRLLLECPLCGVAFSAKQYVIDEDVPRMDVICPESSCPSGGAPLQVYTVDEDIYRERPSLIIATVDKFAQLPRKEEVGLLFGGGDGSPPTLIIQDELHLISGPLGTVAGLYETGIELLCADGGARPKVIGSTATIGRAEQQARALFDRGVLQFPPPGLSADDSFFAVKDEAAPDRLYAGISSAGRSPKFTLQAVTAASLVASQALRHNKEPDELVDPYWTLLLYFNSLRELGGATVQLRDDVSRSAAFYASRLRVEPRRIIGEPREITSRIPSTKIPQILKDLGIGLTTDPARGEALDAVLASNMISVGMDIPRLGLMLMNGQPKAIAEYIQATSRVGRGIPGLVITIFNTARPRDVSHFEHFVNLHQTLYRRVEVTSVTPWSPRARDRALHAVYIAGVRHLEPGMEDRFAAISFDPAGATAKRVRKWILDRVAHCSSYQDDAIDVAAELDVIRDRWKQRARMLETTGGKLEYWATKRPFDDVPVGPHLMRGAEDADAGRDPWVWPTPNSMREVEPSAFYVIWNSFSPVAQPEDPPALEKPPKSKPKPSRRTRT